MPSWPRWPITRQCARFAYNLDLEFIGVVPQCIDFSGRDCSMSVVCCLCGKDLDDAAQRKKRKKLHDANTRPVFERLLSTYNATLGSYIEIRSINAYLCYTCHGEADKLHNKEIQVEKAKRELLDKLCRLTLYTGTQSRKRPNPCTQSHNKQRRIDQTTQSDFCQAQPVTSSFSSSGMY